MPHYCNLEVEFNGLVSKQGQQKCWPFYVRFIPSLSRFVKIFPVEVFKHFSDFPSACQGSFRFFFHFPITFIQ